MTREEILETAKKLADVITQVMQEKGALQPATDDIKVGQPIYVDREG